MTLSLVIGVRELSELGEFRIIIQAKKIDLKLDSLSFLTFLLHYAGWRSQPAS